MYANQIWKNSIFSKIWKNRGYVILAGSPYPQPHISALLDALLSYNLPSYNPKVTQIVVETTSKIYLESTKLSYFSSPQLHFRTSFSVLPDSSTCSKRMAVWRILIDAGCSISPLGVLECPGAHIVVSSAFHPFLACIVHSGKVGVLAKIKEHWWGLSISPSLETTVKTCPQSLVHNIAVASTWNILEDILNILNLQMNFISLPQKRTYCYILVIVDMFSKWIEACWAWKINKWLMPHFDLP